MVVVLIKSALYAKIFSIHEKLVVLIIVLPSRKLILLHRFNESLSLSYLIQFRYKALVAIPITCNYSE